MKKVYLKYQNMYITNIYTNDEYPENEFIAKLELNCSLNYTATYDYDKISYLMNKLGAIGLDTDLMYIEEIEENKEDK